MPPSQERLHREWWRKTENAGFVIHARPSEKGKHMNSSSTDSYRFELTPAGLLITTVEDTVQMNLSPGEALLLDTFIGGAGRRVARREQRRLEREGFSLHSLDLRHGFKTSTHRFEFLDGWLSIFDLQRDAQVSFDPYHVIRLTDFIRGHRRRLMHMPQDPVVPEYFP